MKKNLFSAFIVLFLGLFSCTSPNSTSVNKNMNTENPTTGGTPIVGNDADEHGCRASAGFIWSELKNECIQIFNAGIRLDPQTKYLEATPLSAFVVFKSDNDDAKAEVYIPSQKKALLFNKIATQSKASVWTFDTLTLQQEKGMYILSGNNKQILYKGAVTR